MRTIDPDWQNLISKLSRIIDLDTTARGSGALLRRRIVQDGATLLRLALAYGPGGMSLRSAAWAGLNDVANLSDVALLKRLRGSADWLGDIAGALLADASKAVPSTGSRRLRIADGSSISQPGSAGTDFRLHATYEPALSRFTHLEITDAHGGEAFTRVPLQAGDIVVGDRAYAATIHKAQGMTVDRTHVLATPGLDAHGSYVALSRHRDGIDLHYSRDDFSTHDKLISTLSRDRAKNMATDYEPAQSYAERRSITSHAHDAAVEQKRFPDNAVDRIGDIIFSAHEIRDGAEAPEREPTGREIRQEIEAVAQDTGIDPEDAMRHARRMALMRHAHAVGQVFDAEDAGGKASPAQWEELVDARTAFDAVRPYGWQDAEAAYAKDESLAHDAGSGKVNRAIRALQLETEIRTSPERRADRFVERFHDLKQTGERQYAAGNYSGYHAARAEMGNMAMSLERDPQMESLLEGRKRQLGISMDFDSGMRLGRQLALSHGLGRGRSIGL